MPKYNFDKLINRKGTDCIKWDCNLERFGNAHLLPMWIADMDFQTPQFFLNALKKKIDKGVLGYGCRPKKWGSAVTSWFKEEYNWKIEASQIGFVPGIVVGLCHALRCFTQKGDRVLIQPPVYYPFRNQILAAGCTVVNNPLKLVAKKDKALSTTIYDFEIDWADFEKKIKTCKVFILCNPHNPGGRVWSEAELKKMASIALKYKVLVLSDEIHCDLSFTHHIPFATVNKKQAQNTITFHAPSKTFNCAGLGASEWVAENPKLHSVFESYLSAGEFSSGHYLSFLPAIELYTNKGREWLSQAKEYIWNNIIFTEKYLKENFTVGGKQLVTMVQPHASFLIFLNFRELGISQSQLVSTILNKAHLALNDGATFGPGGEGFMRLNVGCPRATLEKALKAIKRAISTIK